MTIRPVFLWRRAQPLRIVQDQATPQGVLILGQRCPVESPTRVEISGVNRPHRCARSDRGTRQGVRASLPGLKADHSLDCAPRHRLTAISAWSSSWRTCFTASSHISKVGAPTAIRGGHVQFLLRWIP